MVILPALRLQMGSFRYYTVKMNARELSEHVKYASEVYEDRTLDEAIQRILREDRVQEEIVEYLKHQPNRFFSSIVIAALEGNPKFYPVEITEAPEFAIFRDDKRLNESFGVLRFDGTQKYYALDGQHRLSAIKNLLDQTDAPEGFENDELSVILIVPSQEDSNETFMQKYRRLFSNLNRYAKPTDQATNIIMDEDDVFAILTRRLVTDHDFFKSPGKQKESRRIKTKKGKNLTHRDSYFTSLETLYEMNIELLSSAHRKPKGWGPISTDGVDLKTFKCFRPSEEYIDNLYDELIMYWDVLLAEIPDLHKEPEQMRVHELADENSEDETDHVLFWPIGQQILVEVARDLLNKRLLDPENPTPDTVRTALSQLGTLEWRLHQAPWRYFLLVGRATGSWAMRNEQRAATIRCGRRIQQWVIGLDELDESEIKDLKELWKSLLIPSQSDEKCDEMWQQIEERKTSISG